MGRGFSWILADKDLSLVLPSLVPPHLRHGRLFQNRLKWPPWQEDLSEKTWVGGNGVKSLSLILLQNPLGLNFTMINTIKTPSEKIKSVYTRF